MTAPRPRPIARIVQPFQEFTRTESAGGVVLVIATIVALAWANSPWSQVYEDLLDRHIVLDVGFYRLDEALHFWVNDVLMVLFFFLVGLEIKRELTIGEINSVRRAVVPLAAALGGMVIPVAIFFLVVDDPAAQRGWGVPMATDIAFALGVAALLGPRVSTGLKVLLLALAIFDDIGAVAVIAVFYTESVNLLALGGVIAVLAAMRLCAMAEVRAVGVYVVLGIPAWIFAYESGVHPTLLGVAIGLLTPWEAWHGSDAFTHEADEMLTELRNSAGTPREREVRNHLALRLRGLSAEAVAPLDRLEHSLTDWVAFVIVPIFALANAGVDLRGGVLMEAATAPLAWGIALGLLLGKPAGIVLGTFLAARAGAQLPQGSSWPGVVGVGSTAGIGFTVALFVAGLAYTDATLLAEAKVGIFAGSLVSGVLGYTVLRTLRPRSAATGADAV